MDVLPDLDEFFLNADNLFATFVVNALANGVLTVVGAVSNALIVYSLWKMRPSQINPALKAFLFSLSLSDLGVGLVAHPLIVTIAITAVSGKRRAFCIASSACYTASVFFGLASCLTLSIMALDRLAALCLQMRYRTVVTFKLVIRSLVSAWLVSAGFALLPIVNLSAHSKSHIVVISTCLTVTSVAYLKMYLRLRQQHRRINVDETVAAPKSRVAWCHVHWHKRTVGNMFSIFFATLLCFTPYTVSVIAALIVGWSTSVQKAHILSGTIVLMNSSLNPFLYCWRIRSLRQKVKEVLSFTRGCRCSLSVQSNFINTDTEGTGPINCPH